jgi:hypothetical protein
LFATFATLFFVPCVFKIIHKNYKPRTIEDAAQVR